MKRKILAMFLCVALTFAIFGTLAVGAEENVEQPAADPTCTCGTEDETHAEDCALYEKDETKVEPPACTCGTENETHAEDCALYTAPETEQKEEIQEESKDETKEEPKDETKEETKEETKDETKDEAKDETKDEPKEETKDETKDETKEEPKVETPVCNCGAEDDDHKETCPLYKTLFQRLMACETFDEMSEMLESLTEEEFATLTEEQVDQVYDRKDALEPEPLPAVCLEETTDVIVPSVIVRETVNFTNVAPLCGTSNG